MKLENKGVGLDIGTTKIVAMLGRKNEYGKLKIIGAGKSESLGVHRGVVNNITQTIQSIQSAVQDAEAASGETIREVVVGLLVSTSAVFIIVIISQGQIQRKSFRNQMWKN